VNHEIDVQLACEEDVTPHPDTIAAWVNRAIDAAGRSGDVEVSVRIVAADEIRELNRDYRDKDEATNVLSFPAGDMAGIPAGAPEMLGDIVVCASVVRDEASDQGKSLEDHWAHMLVHGTLHLLGFDHETEPQAEEMESLETRILAEHGLADPYRAPNQN
jgi:probable rRNA maturation factor